MHMGEPIPEPRFFDIPRRPAFDVALAVVVWIGTTVALLTYRHGHLQSAPWTSYLIVAVASWALALRGQRPRVMIACVVAAAALRGAVSGMPQVTSLPLAIGLISFAAQRPLREALLAALTAFGALMVAIALGGNELSLTAIASRLLFATGITALGLFIGARRAYSEQLRERARGLERERELLAERAVDEERVRIARELHDAIAHHVSLLVVQAGAVRESLPEGSPAREVADSMASTGRQALEEMRSVLGVLRTGGQRTGVERAPQPGVADIRALVEQTGLAKVDAELAVEGVERALPVGIDLSAYRIVQESLTNVVKHAAPARAHVLVRYLPEALELEVTDNGPGGRNGGRTPSAGHGIVGMRERVSLFGGELSAGPATGGGWRVHALLPLERRP